MQERVKEKKKPKGNQRWPKKNRIHHQDNANLHLITCLKKHRWITCLWAHRWWLPSLSLFLLRFCWKCFSFHCERVRAIVANENHRQFNLKNVWNRSKTQPTNFSPYPFPIAFCINLSFSLFSLSIFWSFWLHLSFSQSSFSCHLCLDPSFKMQIPWDASNKKRSRKNDDSCVPVAAQTQFAFFSLSLLFCNVHMDSMTHLHDSTVHWTQSREKKSRVLFACLAHTTTKRLLSSICNTFNLHLLNVSGFFFHSLTTYFFTSFFTF